MIHYDYAIRDHLGNTRILFTDKNNNGVLNVTAGTDNEIIQENQYYPFGMNQEGAWMNDAAAKDTKYQYNGKELNDDFGLGWSDYGARWYDAAIGRWNGVDILAEKYFSFSPYNYTLNIPISAIDPNGMNVIVDVQDRDGKEHIQITYNGVLIDKTNSSAEEIEKIRADIIKQLMLSFTGSSENRSWGIDVNLRIGTAAEGEGENRESTIQLINDPNQSSTHLNGFDAIVAKNTFTGNLAQTAAHEVGHTMGLPHIIEYSVEGGPGIFTQPNFSLITNDNPITKNLMIPGPFPDHLRGDKILESQILNIRDDAQAKPSRLNKENISGSTYLWSTFQNDTPAYKFKYLFNLKVQILSQSQ